MHLVMIIDDEEVVRDGIRDLIDWEAEGFEVCAEGRDGRDGLKKLLKYRPHLALVDIKMPGMSGIELIRAAREEEFDGWFIILTGYSEFEFARSAISLGVKAYVLKPIDEDELVSVVREIHREIVKSEKEKAYHSGNEDKAREELLRRILLKLEEKEKLEQEAERYGLELSGETFCAAILCQKGLELGNEASGFFEKTEELLKESGKDTLRVVMDGRVVLVNTGLDYRSWAGKLEESNLRILRRYGEGFSISVGHNVARWYDLCYSYEFAKYLSDNEFLFGSDGPLTMDVIGSRQRMGENPGMDYFFMLMEIGEPDAIREGVSRFGHYCADRLMPEADIKVKVLYNLMLLKEWLEHKYGGGEIPDPSLYTEELVKARGLDELLESYCRIMEEVSRHVGCVSTDSVTKRMYYYMEKNYDKNLKLESLAKLFNYNSTYLGKIFRRETGESFNNVLDKIRIANARRLLKETELKVYQISEQVGYGDLDYFYLKFKKNVGVSPGEYRKMLPEKGES